ncbi:MAG: thioesterase family protein [Celeribacter sp.]|jgi:acyl-CoA thioesterase
MRDKIDPDDWLPRLTEVTPPAPGLRSWTCLPWEDVTDKAFGGELMAQSARAALRLHPEDRRLLHSVATQFAAPIRGGVELRHDVRLLTDGGRYRRVMVEASQEGRLLAASLMSFMTPQADAGEVPRDAPPPPLENSFELPEGSLRRMLARDDRLEKRMGAYAPAEGAFGYWFRVSPGMAPALASDPAERLVCALYASDRTVMAAAQEAVMTAQGDTDTDYYLATLNHDVHVFDAQASLSEWLYMSVAADLARLGRVIVTGAVRDAAGRVVLRYRQQGVMSPLKR